MNSDLDDFKAFMKQREEASQAYVNGDAAPLDALSTHGSPASLFGPKGDSVEGAQAVNARNERDAASFEQGSETHFEVMQMAADGALAYWAGIQRSTVIFKGAQATPLDLRITEVFQREGGAWKLVHRHADPLAHDTEKKGK